MIRAEVVEYSDIKGVLMATKAPPGKRRKKKKKIRLSLKSSKIKKTDSYSDSLGWSTDVGRTLNDPEKPKEPDTIKHQCQMCQYYDGSKAEKIEIHNHMSALRTPRTIQLS